MTIADNVQTFLKEKLIITKLKRKDFVEQSGVPSATFNKIINTSQHNTEFKNLLKIANYFNASLDEVIGRENFVKNKALKNLSSDKASVFLKAFLKNKVEEGSLNLYQLSKDSGLAAQTLQGFLREGSPKNLLSTNSLVSVANYFNVSLDEMIGRIDIAKQQTQEIAPSSSLLDQQQIITKLDKKDLEEIENIRISLLQQQNIASPKSSHTTPIPKIGKDTNKTLGK